MEEKERGILNALQDTLKKNTSMMKDLSKKSEALTNTLIPRNPIPPKNKKYPMHSEYGYRPQNSVGSNNGSYLKKRYWNRNSIEGGGSHFDSLTVDDNTLSFA